MSLSSGLGRRTPGSYAASVCTVAARDWSKPGTLSRILGFQIGKGKQFFDRKTIGDRAHRAHALTVRQDRFTPVIVVHSVVINFKISIDPGQVTG